MNEIIDQVRRHDLACASHPHYTIAPSVYTAVARPPDIIFDNPAAPTGSKTPPI